MVSVARKYLFRFSDVEHVRQQFLSNEDNAHSISSVVKQWDIIKCCRVLVRP